MNVWLCPVKPRSWNAIKIEKIFGVPRRALKTFTRVRTGDLLVFHVFKPINGIVAVCKVESEVFESHQDIWGKGRYPFRVRIEFIPKLTRNESKPVPLRFLFGKIDDEGEVAVEPYLRGICITRISNEQYKKLLKLFSHNVNERARD